MWAEIDLRNKKVKRIINGIRGKNCLPVVDNSVYPTDPDIFKAAPEYRYVVDVAYWLDDVEDKANWSFSDADNVEQIATQGILPLAQCKEEVYKILAAKRWEIETSGMEFNGISIPTDRENSLIIASIPAMDLPSFKISNGNWIGPFTAAEISALKVAHRDFIQAAFDWERGQSDLVVAMDYSELVAYLNALKGS